jgi:signal transduction histidine kinase
MSDGSDHELLLISNTSPSIEQKRLAALIVVVLLGILAFAVPFARQRLDGSEAFMPAYAAAILLIEVMTAALLMGVVIVQRSRAVLLLAIGYLLSGFMVVPWALTFPGVFQSLGLDQGLQSTAVIAAFRRLSFPMFIIGYAILKERRGDRFRNPHSAKALIGISVALVSLTTATIAYVLVTHDHVAPQFMIDRSTIAANWRYVSGTSVALYVVAISILLIRLRSILDLWLIVAICTLLIEILLLSYISGGIRLSVGWWSGRAYGLASASIVLLVFLHETTNLYERLGRSLLSERRAREARLTAMEALSASIAHEVNQPLASMVTNADAALYWLDRDSPELEEVSAALKGVVANGQRAGEVVRGIRDLFKNGTREQVPINLNALIREVVERSMTDAQAIRLNIVMDLEAGLPSPIGTAVHLQAVVSNLIMNALDAMVAAPGRSLSVRVSAYRDDREIIVSVADTGTGMDPSVRDRVFEPFVTTKANGMGMGLMFCKSIIDAHGGRIWAVPNTPRGTIFNFSLPVDDTADAPLPAVVQ